MRPSSSPYEDPFGPVFGDAEVDAACGAQAWLASMLEAEAALAEALADVGVMPAAAAAAIGAACRSGAVTTEVFAAAESASPVVPLVATLGEAVPAPAAGWVHFGATSQDIMDSAMMLVFLRATAIVSARLAAAARHAARLAAEHRDTLQIGRTLGQPAAPTTFGAVAAGWLGGIDAARAELARARGTLAAQLGGPVGILDGYANPTAADDAAGAGGGHADHDDAGPTPQHGSAGGPPDDHGADPMSPGDGAAGTPGDPGDPTSAVGDPENARRGVAGQRVDPASRIGADARGPSVLSAFARRLGLADPGVPWHTDRTRVARLAAALATAAGAVGKVARDVTLLGSGDVGELREGEGGGSSAMPQKRNPARAVLVAANARRAPGLASTVFSAMDAELQRPAGAWQAEWQTLGELLRCCGGAAHHAAALLSGLEVDAARMRSHVDAAGGPIRAAAVAGRLAPLLGRGEAHRRVAAAAGAPDFRRALGADAAVAARLSPSELDDMCDPAACLPAARAIVDRALQLHRDREAT